MGTTTGGTRRRILMSAAATAAVLAGLAALPGVSSAAVPQPDTGTALHVSGVSHLSAEARLERLLDRRVRQRERALTSITQQAAQYEEVKADEVSRLAALGYTGDLADLTHVLPLAGYYLSAGYGLAGPLWEHSHTGQDFAAPLGTSLVAVGDGVVTSVGDSGPYGLRTILTLEDGTEIWYCHQLLTLVEPGDAVEVGDALGGLGSTGNSTGPHLHLEVRPPGVGPVDPMPWLEALGLTP